MKLKDLIVRYVTIKESLGERFQTNKRILKAFLRAVGEDLDVNEVRADQVHDFIAGRGPLTRNWEVKHSALLGFYRYAISRGHIKSSPLPRAVPKLPPRFVPYIYTRDELCHLLTSIESYQRPDVLLEPYTFRAILLMLYGAGLRLGEALSFTLADVDLVGALVIVRETKFHKTRIVPLGTQLNQALVRYAHQRRQEGHSQQADAPFFVASTGIQLNHQHVERAFVRLRDHAGVRRADGARYQPRLHDLRHTFAVHRLTSWYRKGADVQRLLPKLATYLGHVEIASTQVYLTMTPELLHEASRRFEQYVMKEANHVR